MASKSAALLLSINFLFFAMVTSARLSSSSPSLSSSLSALPSTCPSDTLKLGACVEVLNALYLGVDVPENSQCCPLIGGLIQANATACLCTFVELDLLQIIQVNATVSLNLLWDHCKVPNGFKCP